MAYHLLYCCFVATWTLQNTQCVFCICILAQVLYFRRIMVFSNRFSAFDGRRSRSHLGLALKLVSPFCVCPSRVLPQWYPIAFCNHFSPFSDQVSKSFVPGIDYCFLTSFCLSYFQADNFDPAESSLLLTNFAAVWPVRNSWIRSGGGPTFSTLRPCVVCPQFTIKPVSALHQLSQPKNFESKRKNRR